MPHFLLILSINQNSMFSKCPQGLQDMTNKTGTQIGGSALIYKVLDFWLFMDRKYIRTYGILLVPLSTELFTGTLLSYFAIWTSPLCYHSPDALYWLYQIIIAKLCSFKLSFKCLRESSTDIYRAATGYFILTVKVYWYWTDLINTP